MCSRLSFYMIIGFFHFFPFLISRDLPWWCTFVRENGWCADRGMHSTHTTEKSTVHFSVCFSVHCVCVHFCLFLLCMYTSVSLPLLYVFISVCLRFPLFICTRDKGDVFISVFVSLQIHFVSLEMCLGFF